MAGGRQREFDKADALDNAMRVFWQKGYVGASLADLTRSMQINKPSMYSTFGNKEQLFIQAVEHYLTHYIETLGEPLTTDEPIKVRLKNYLLSVITQQCDENTPKGCFISLCVAEYEGEAFPDQSALLVEKLAVFAEAFLEAFFKEEIARKRLPETVNSVMLARYIAVFMHGTAAMSRGGKTQQALEELVDIVIQVIP